MTDEKKSAITERPLDELVVPPNITPRQLAKRIERGERYTLHCVKKLYTYPCSKHGLWPCKECGSG